MRYLACNLIYSTPKSITQTGPDIEVLFVVSGKDSNLLPLAMKGAIASTQFNQLSRITIICPRSDLDLIQKKVDECSSPITRIIPEDVVISNPQIAVLRKAFGERAGWVLQQLLKVEYVKNSNSSGILIVDADTILLKNRLWLDSKMTQVLMPTWEQHRPYRDFLKENSFDCIENSLSHISHHMLFQPIIVREMLATYRITDLDYFMSLLIQFATKGNSPFSIDYEMYAQFMLKNHTHLIRLEKWANVSLNGHQTSELNSEIPKFRTRYHSVSAHSYNQV